MVFITFKSRDQKMLQGVRCALARGILKSMKIKTKRFFTTGEKNEVQLEFCVVSHLSCLSFLYLFCLGYFFIGEYTISNDTCHIIYFSIVKNMSENKLSSPLKHRGTHI
jgi:3-deoxy-D-arabino-heptulosonate 7-phosphate (DAHP) synthase class II